MSLLSWVVQNYIFLPDLMFLSFMGHLPLLPGPPRLVSQTPFCLDQLPVALGWLQVSSLPGRWQMTVEVPQADLERQLDLCQSVRPRPTRQRYQGQLGFAGELSYILFNNSFYNLLDFSCKLTIILSTEWCAFEEIRKIRNKTPQGEHVYYYYILTPRIRYSYSSCCSVTKNPG